MVLLFGLMGGVCRLKCVVWFLLLENGRGLIMNNWILLWFCCV